MASSSYRPEHFLFTSEPLLEHHGVDDDERGHVRHFIAGRSAKHLRNAGKRAGGNVELGSRATRSLIENVDGLFQISRRRSR